RLPTDVERAFSSSTIIGLQRKQRRTASPAVATLTLRRAGAGGEADDHAASSLPISPLATARHFSLTNPPYSRRKKCTLNSCAGSLHMATEAKPHAPANSRKPLGVYL